MPTEQGLMVNDVAEDTSAIGRHAHCQRHVTLQAHALACPAVKHTA